MNYNFPKIRFVDENSIDEQLDHLRSELVEAYHAFLSGHMGDCDMEVADLYHSCETYFRMREKAGVDIEAVRQAVIEKNTNRGYYNESNIDR